LPDIALIDWMLPGQSGLALTSKLRKEPRTRSLPIILLTARGEEVDRIAGLEGGADDYVVKPFSPKELLARIQAVLRRCSPEHVKGTLSAGPITLDTVSHEASVEGQRITLTPTEFRLLRFLMASPGRVYSRQQLLDNVWGRSCLHRRPHGRYPHPAPARRSRRGRRTYGRNRAWRRLQAVRPARSQGSRPFEHPPMMKALLVSAPSPRSFSCSGGREFRESLARLSQ
jgi:hypothetical protein